MKGQRLHTLGTMVQSVGPQPCTWLQHKYLQCLLGAEAPNTPQQSLGEIYGAIFDCKKKFKKNPQTHTHTHKIYTIYERDRILERLQRGVRKVKTKSPAATVFNKCQLLCPRTILNAKLNNKICLRAHFSSELDEIFAVHFSLPSTTVRRRHRQMVRCGLQEESQQRMVLTSVHLSHTQLQHDPGEAVFVQKTPLLFHSSIELVRSYSAVQSPTVERRRYKATYFQLSIGGRGSKCHRPCNLPG